MGKYCSVRIAFVLSILTALLACSGLDDVNSRLDALESEVRDLKTAVSLLDKAYKDGKVVSSVIPQKNEEGNDIGWIITFTDNTTIKLKNGKDGDSFFESIETKDGLVIFTMKNGTVYKFTLLEAPDPKVLRMDFLSDDNPKQLVSDVSCSISDSTITCWVSHLMINKLLIPRFEIEGDEVYLVGGGNLLNGVTSCDFSKPTELIVKSGEREKKYVVYVHAFTGLPVMWIETEGRQDIRSKEEYLHAKFRLVEDVMTRSAGEVIEGNVNIKGRVNNTWELPPKKSYRLKFDEKNSLLNEPADKSWVLLANYYDRSLIRSTAVFYLGSISRLSYTPRYHFVELFLNGRYDGTYQLIDKLKISKHRLNIGNDGFLVESDRYATVEEDARYFKIDHLEYPLNIKDPDVEYDDESFNYVKKYFEDTVAALYSDNFADPDKGWQKYIDAESFVDWYIINEICKSCEHYWFLTYFNLQKGGKLKLGPLWDYDKCFGNYAPYVGCENPEGFWVKNCEWFVRLFEDPVFVTMVKERFKYFYEAREDVLRVINENASYLKYSSIENNNRWGVLYTPNQYDPHDYDIYGAYYNEIVSLKNWISKRFEWLNTAIEDL